ncbi:MAG: ATP-binding protein [Clostridiales bacterium]|nr:ATP-binding protein [Clostridiales bacterium]
MLAGAAAHLFDPFVQGDTSRSRKSGNGLGLSIAKKIILMHGGNLELEQTADGKTFLITLNNIASDY